MPKRKVIKNKESGARYVYLGIGPYKDEELVVLGPQSISTKLVILNRDQYREKYEETSLSVQSNW